MSRLKTSHIVEAAFWLTLVAIFFAYSFEFNKEIEIYKYGATLWPRTILFLMALAAIGQLIDQYKNGDTTSSSKMAAAHEEPEANPEHSGLAWYTSTAIILAIPFVYMNLPEYITGSMNVAEDAREQTLANMKLMCAAGLFILYLILGWRNHVGAILALPIFFAAVLQDMGFYAMAPLFIVGVMILMGERRVSRMALVMPLIYGLLLLFFVALLYVGLPTGNINPFYNFGNWIVTLLQ